VRVSRPLLVLPAAVEVSAYRIAVEAVTNVVRHAGARTCTVALDRDECGLVVTVADDGNGVPAPRIGGPGGNGMATMRKRAEELGGAVTVNRSVGGTTVTARLPVDAVAPVPA
jgi:signal transduction histidine kinase